MGKKKNKGVVPVVETETVVETATPAATPVRASKFKGLGTCQALGIPGGLRRMEFQDRLLASNDRDDMRKTDEALAAMMDAEHPGGVKIRPDHMRAIRRLYNEGKHTKNGRVPAELSVPYDSAGKPLAELRRTRRAA